MPWLFAPGCPDCGCDEEDDTIVFPCCDIGTPPGFETPNCCTTQPIKKNLFATIIIRNLAFDIIASFSVPIFYRTDTTWGGVPNKAGWFGCTDNRDPEVDCVQALAVFFTCVSATFEVDIDPFNPPIGPEDPINCTDIGNNITTIRDAQCHSLNCTPGSFEITSAVVSWDSDWCGPTFINAIISE